jgi:hypothetical protein
VLGLLVGGDLKLLTGVESEKADVLQKGLKLTQNR